MRVDPGSDPDTCCFLFPRIQCQNFSFLRFDSFDLRRQMLHLSFCSCRLRIPPQGTSCSQKFTSLELKAAILRRKLAKNQFVTANKTSRHFPSLSDCLRLTREILQESTNCWKKHCYQRTWRPSLGPFERGQPLMPHPWSPDL